MAILNKGNTYSSGQSVTAANLNALVDSATFKTGNGEAVDGSTLQVHSNGYILVKDGGITAAKLASGAVAAGAITDTQLASNAVTSIKILDANVIESKIAANAISASKISDTDAQFLVDDTSTQKKVVINEGGADVDFRVEGDTDANLLFCDATNDKVGIGITPGSTYKLNVNSATANIANFETAATSSALFIRSTNNSATSSILQLVAQASGGSSYSKNMNIDLNASNNTLQMAFGTGDGIGFRITNSNGGSGSETGSISPLHDNKSSVGLSSKRWSVIFAGTGTINTSDRNSKEEIQDLSDAELRVAQACKGLVKRFKFKGGTRKHIGVIAQDVRDAFTAESLDAHEYGLFCSDTWTDEDGEEVTQLGIRYDELLAFIIAAL